MEIKKYRLQTEMENLKEGNEEWFKDYVTKPYEFEVQTKSNTKLEHHFSVNEFAKEDEYSFDFFLEAHYRILKFGNGIDEPVEHEIKIYSYSEYEMLIRKKEAVHEDFEKHFINNKEVLIYLD